MKFKETTATRKIKALSKRIRAVQGGTSASKTVSILLYLIASAQTDEQPTLTSVIAESMPHLRRGALRDFKNIMQAHHYWDDNAWRESDKLYTFETGSQIEFFPVDQPDKLRGGRRDRCFMNEANNCPYDAFWQLLLRTREFMFLDWNPSHEFWYYTDVEPNRDDVEHIIVTYKDNEALDEQTIQEIESWKHNSQIWKVYGLGQLGQLETQIYKSWSILDEIPDGARLVRRGLDFGYTNDPTAIVDIYRYNEGYIWDEQLYRKGMSNQQIADYLVNLPSPNTLVVADSAEPKSIDEIKSYGVPILPSEKGRDSVKQGIQLVQSVPHYVTKRSTNVIKEQRNYLWQTDKDGKVLNAPIDLFNHCMDAGRYAEQSLKPNSRGFDKVNTDQNQHGVHSESIAGSLYREEF